MAVMMSANVAAAPAPAPVKSVWRKYAPCVLPSLVCLFGARALEIGFLTRGAWAVHM